MKHSDLKLKNQDREDFYEVRDKQIYEDLEDAEVFRIKGPLGRGLQIEQGGVHVAFCGGTGLLVFIDLVAHLILRNAILGTNRVKNVPDTLKQLDHSFIFLLLNMPGSFPGNLGFGRVWAGAWTSQTILKI